MATKKFERGLVFFDGQKSMAAWDVDSMTGWTSLSDDGEKTQEAKYFASVPWFYRGVKDRSNNVGRMPFAIMRNGEEIDTSTDYQNVLEFMPNPTSLYKRIEMSLAVTGKAYLRKEINKSGYIKGLRYLVPTSITEKYNDDGTIKYYERKVKGQTYELKPEEVVAIYDPDYTTENGPPTSSAGMAALASSGVLFNVDKFVSNYFGGGAIKATIFSVKGVSKEDAKTFKEWFNDTVTGLANAWKTHVLNGDEVKPVVIGEGLESLENQTLTTERRQNIATALGVPESRMWSAAANYATRVQDDKAYFEGTIIPDCDLIAEAFKEQVFTPVHHLEGYSIVFQYETLDIFQTDAAAQAGALQQLKNAGVPLLMAMDLLGFDLTEEQRAELEAMADDKEEQADALAENPTQADGDAPQGEPVDQEQDTPMEQPAPQAQGNPAEMRTALATWKRKALYGLKKHGAADAEFVTSVLPVILVERIHAGLTLAKSEDDVKAVFAGIDVDEIKAEPAPITIVEDYTEQDKFAIIKRACDLFELIHAN